MTLRFVAVDVDTGGCYSDGPKMIRKQVWDTTCSTLIKARDELIKRERKTYIQELYQPGDEGYTPASECFSKFPFGKELVGYYSYDTGLSFLFDDKSPVYDCIVQERIPEQELVKRLLDLYDWYQEQKETV